MIDDIRLQYFRSYSDETFEFSPGVNIIVGPNASGKTNLLESLQFICSGKSYRSRDIELIHFGADRLKINAHTKTGDRSVVVEKDGQFSKKQFIVNGQKRTRLALHNSLPVALFEPSHLRLLSGGPELRRDWLDDLLEQMISGYSTTRRAYKRALSQRNSLLKQGPSQAKSQMFAWNIRLSELGAQIVEHRQKLINSCAEQINKLYKDLSHSKKIAAISYQGLAAPEVYSTKFLRKLESHEQQDYERGFTSYGPHREDIVITLDEHNVQESASRGESRTLILALKIIETKLLEAARNQRPILLLDDVFSELDGARRHALTDYLRDYQTFITTTDADVVMQHFMDNCRIIPIGAKKSS